METKILTLTYQIQFCILSDLISSLLHSLLLHSCLPFLQTQEEYFCLSVFEPESTSTWSSLPTYTLMAQSYFLLILFSSHPSCFWKKFFLFIPNPKCCSKRAISFLIYFLFFLPCLNFLQEFYYCLVFYVIAGIYCNSSVPHWNGHFRVNISFLYFTAIATVLKTAPGAKQKILNR